MAFIELPVGRFEMGTEDLGALVDELTEGRVMRVHDEQPARQVRFQKPLWIGRTEVTQGQWLDVMRTRPGPNDNLPVGEIQVQYPQPDGFHHPHAVPYIRRATSPAVPAIPLKPGSSRPDWVRSGYDVVW